MGCLWWQLNILGGGQEYIFAPALQIISKVKRPTWLEWKSYHVSPLKCAGAQEAYWGLGCACCGDCCWNNLWGRTRKSCTGAVSLLLSTIVLFCKVCHFTRGLGKERTNNGQLYKTGASVCGVAVKKLKSRCRKTGRVLNYLTQNLILPGIGGYVYLHLYTRCDGVFMAPKLK